MHFQTDTRHTHQSLGDHQPDSDRPEWHNNIVCWQPQFQRCYGIAQQWRSVHLQLANQRLRSRKLSGHGGARGWHQRHANNHAWEDRGRSTVQGVGIVDGTLYIIGTEGRDHVELKFNEKNDQLTVDAKLNQGGSDGGSDRRSDGGSDKAKSKTGSDGGSDGGRDDIKLTFTASEIDRIVAYLGGGDDYYDGGDRGSDGGSDGRRDHGLDAAIPQFVFGGAGDDHIQGGRGNNVLSGGSGNDDIQGGSGRNILIGGSGKDKLKGGRDNDLLIGGSAAKENDFAALDAALADWATGGLAAALVDVGSLTDDDDKDDLKGEQGSDALIGGLRDKVTQ